MNYLDKKINTKIKRVYGAVGQYPMVKLSVAPVMVTFQNILHTRGESDSNINFYLNEHPLNVFVQLNQFYDDFITSLINRGLSPAIRLMREPIKRSIKSKKRAKWAIPTHLNEEVQGQQQSSGKQYFGNGLLMNPIITKWNIENHIKIKLA